MITGKALAEKILRQITEQPETHNQDIWATSNDCGTVACIAGWAVEFNRNEGEGENRALRRLANELDTPPWFDTVGRELLGLDRGTASNLFYAPSNRRARIRLAEAFDLPVPE